MREKEMICPHGHGKMKLKKVEKKIHFRGADIKFHAEHFVCPDCGTEAGTVDQTAATQKTIADAYRKTAHLLTSKEIVEGRQKLNLTQADLAQRMHVGIASIKRWERGVIQSKSMDHALRVALRGESIGDTCTGNREFSTQRVKLVLQEFELALGKKILKKNDKMLYAAKYLWYADMVAHREIGQSMTGSSYAALPFGPQLNNYKDLVMEIMNAKVEKAEPLSPEEKRIINRIALKFPKEQMIYNATHKETIWKRQPTGAIIPYTDSTELIHI